MGRMTCAMEEECMSSSGFELKSQYPRGELKFLISYLQLKDFNIYILGMLLYGYTLQEENFHGSLNFFIPLMANSLNFNSMY